MEQEKRPSEIASFTCWQHDYSVHFRFSTITFACYLFPLKQYYLCKGEKRYREICKGQLQNGRWRPAWDTKDFMCNYTAGYVTELPHLPSSTAACESTTVSFVSGSINGKPELPINNFPPAYAQSTASGEALIFRTCVEHNTAILICSYLLSPLKVEPYSLVPSA